MNVSRLRQARDGLPRRLNAGILMGDGGFCVLGWMLACAGFHPIAIYANTIAVVDSKRGGSAIEVVAREYELPVETVAALATLNDAASREERSEAVRARLDVILGSAS